MLNEDYNSNREFNDSDYQGRDEFEVTNSENAAIWSFICIGGLILLLLISEVVVPVLKGAYHVS